MQSLISKFESKNSSCPVPYFKEPKLALNVAACDQSLLVMVKGKSYSTSLKQIEPAAWSETLAGNVQYSRWPGIGPLPDINNLHTDLPGWFLYR